jgi:TonB family protein
MEPHMRNLSLILMLFASSSAAFAGDDAAAIDDLLKSIPTIETKRSDADLAAEARQTVLDSRVSYDSYVITVQSHVLAQWKPSQRLLKSEPPLEAQLSVKIAADGTVSDVGAVMLSGNKKWDQAALDAVNAASPVPAPPDTLLVEAGQGVVVRFSPATVAK